jgi:hypothetical protein
MLEKSGKREAAKVLSSKSISNINKVEK